MLQELFGLHFNKYVIGVYSKDTKY